MKHVRACIRLLLFALTLLVHGLLLVAWSLFTRIRPSARSRGRSLLGKSLASSLAWIMGMRIHVSGIPPVRPFILVANHLSWIDIILVHTTTRGVLISKAEVASWPVVGWIARQVGTAFIDRNNIRDVVRMNEQIERILEEGDGVVFFPEGTSTDGSSVRPFRSPLLNYPAKTSYPVHHATITYRTETVDPTTAICWWGDMAFANHFYFVMTLPGFDAYIRFGSKPIVHTDRKELAEKLHKNVSQSFIPVSSRSGS